MIKLVSASKASLERGFLFMAKQNEPLVKHIYTADPSARVFNGKIYIYTSHDLEHSGEDNDNGDQYQMEDYHVLTLDDIDAPCADNGEILNMRDVPWVSRQMWAPDCVEKDGKYYLYFPARDKDGVLRIGVAISDSPAGPFKPEPDFIKGSHSIDPGLFIDDDGSCYIYFGGLWGGQLEKWQTGEFVANPAPIPEDADALGPKMARLSPDMKSFAADIKEIKIIDENGNPIKAGDEDRRYFEDPWMHKYNGKYYLSYSTGTTHYIVYATGDSPEGPFIYQGRILEPVIGWTTHHSIVEHKGKWYLFYHDSSLSGGISHRRCVKFRELKYDADGRIITMKPYEE